MRTLAQCTEEAARDITVATALLEARWLCGSRTLMRAFDASVRARIDRETFLRAKRLEQEQRHAKFEDSPYSLEPNLKEAPGGLRDLHVIVWACRAAGIGQDWRELARRGLVTRSESGQLARVERFLSDVRIRLHLAARRREDRVLFDYQTELARQYGLTDQPGKRASEQFMQRYYRTAKAVTQMNTIVLQNLLGSLQPASAASSRPLNERFRCVHDLLDVVDEGVFEAHPGAIFESFRLMQQHAELQGMTARTLRGLWRARALINPAFRRSEQNRAAFIRLLQAPRGIVHEFRRMNQYGILGRYLPAFGRIVGQMQHDLFHVYTVDQHILMVVRNLRRFTMPEFSHEYPECSRLIANFDQPWLLYVAALFHDIAKGRGGDHSQLGRVDALRFCREHGLPPADGDLVGFLVAHHLTMSSIAQKSDLTDPGVIAQFAGIVGTERRLNALYLLTVADIRGTSPKVWNAWKAKLLEGLYRLTINFLTSGGSQIDRDVEHKQTEARRLIGLYGLAVDAAGPLWSRLDMAYFLQHEPQEIAWQARSLHARVFTETPEVRARLAPMGEGIEALIYMPDKRDLFAQICAYFDSIRFTIVDAKIHTTRHGYALDSFTILSADRHPVYPEMLTRIEKALAKHLATPAALPEERRGRVSRMLKHFPIEPQVRLRADEKNEYFSLSVTAGDRPGLLFTTARLFAKYGLNLHSARINTLGERAEDVFVVDGPILSNPVSVIAFESELLESLR